MKQSTIIAPSILSADFAHLGKDVHAVIQAGANWIHFDVMDNHFVPNLSVGAMVCQALTNDGVTVPIDVHLMVKPVDALIHAFAKAGASYITFHPEASDDVDASLTLIHDYGLKAGLALNPDIDVSLLSPYLDRLDLILLMSVFPGFGGQAFIPDVLPKIKSVRQIIDETSRQIRLSVDGGINEQTIKEAAKQGADTFVAGSSIFKYDNYHDAISTLTNAINAIK